MDAIARNRDVLTAPSAARNGRNVVRLHGHERSRGRGSRGRSTARGCDHFLTGDATPARRPLPPPRATKTPCTENGSASRSGSCSASSVRGSRRRRVAGAVSGFYFAHCSVRSGSSSRRCLLASTDDPLGHGPSGRGHHIVRHCVEPARRPSTPLCHTEIRTPSAPK